MTNLPPISDGQPVTYEFLNLMVGAINNLSKAANSQGETPKNQDIEVGGVGYPITAQTGVSIVVGKFSLKFGSIQNAKQSTAQTTVKFSGQFKSDPLVFVTPVDPSADDNADISYVSLVLAKVSKTQFTCKGRRMVAGKDATNKDTLDVNFIAIGPSA